MVKFVIILVLSFVVMLGIDKLICSKRFNRWYLTKCENSLNKFTEEKCEATLQWLRQHTEASLTKETSWREIVAALPLELRYKVKEKQVRGYMSKLGYLYVSDCFLDTAYFSVELKVEV